MHVRKVEERGGEGSKNMRERERKRRRERLRDLLGANSKRCLHSSQNLHSEKHRNHSGSISYQFTHHMTFTRMYNTILYVYINILFSTMLEPLH